MAAVSVISRKLLLRTLRRQIGLPRIQNLYRLQSTNQDTISSFSRFDESLSDSENDALIEELKDVSRMSMNHRMQYHGHAPELPYIELRNQRKLYAKFGSASSEDPRIMWPSRKELLRMEEEEKEEGVNLSEALASIAAEKKAAEKALIERRAMIEKNMAQMPKLVADYKRRLQTAEDAQKERKAKKDALLEEAREYFGYKIQANDPKFTQMLEERAEKEKKEAKQRKKEDKLKKAAARVKLEKQSTS